jgi:oxysterol-binding protein-related protein 8
MSADELTPESLWDKAVPDPEAGLAGSTETSEPPHPSVIGHLLKSLSPGQDLTRVTIPAFFLEPRSLLERLADTLLHPDLILEASKAKTPLERITGVVRWFLSGFHYKTLGVQKPYNPIIGETFACYWKHDDGSKSQYFAEQVLHRPPVSLEDDAATKLFVKH